MNDYMGGKQLQSCFEKWCEKLRLVPGWDVKLELVSDPDVAENRGLQGGLRR